MKQPKIAQKLVVFLGIALSTAACSSSDGGSGTGGGGGTTADGSAGSGGSSSGCTVSCDDGFSCTIDTCNGSKCTHGIGPNSGATACPTGQYCTVDKGCIASPACVNVMDCQKAFTDDACKTNVKCDQASSVCVFDIMDKDDDGYPPPVCGGDDCDDSNEFIHPGASETCDGKDNDCNGMVDNGASCSKTGTSCISGQCACPTGTKECSDTCVNTKEDPLNCGVCGNTCAAGAVCSNGNCTCKPGHFTCSETEICVPIDNNSCHCHKCPAGSTCDPSLGPNGVCVGCPASQQCDGDCYDFMTDFWNCGSCDNICNSMVCENGKCK